MLNDNSGEPEVETPEEPPHPAAFELDTLQECKRLWLEYTRNTLSGEFTNRLAD